MPRYRPLVYLAEDDLRTIAEALTAQLFKDTPAFHLLGSQGRDRMLSALAMPRWRRHGTLPTKAAALHYHLNKAHAYADGNKRIALTSADLFLLFNNAFLWASDAELEDLALGVAANRIPPEENQTFFSRRCVRLEWDDDRMSDFVDRLDPSLLHKDQARILRVRQAIAEVAGGFREAIEDESVPAENKGGGP